MQTIWEYNLGQETIIQYPIDQGQPKAEFPSILYRYFKEEEHADQFVNRSIRIGTLEQYRRCEQAGRGDGGEGVKVYNSGYVAGDGTDERLQTISRRAGIYIHPSCKAVTISNNTKVEKSNAYVLCMTHKYSKTEFVTEFGKYCVEITNPIMLFIEISVRLQELIGQCRCYAGSVIYKDRDYKHLEQDPGPVSFIKPKNLFEYQAEFRLLWVPTQQPVQHDGLSVIVPALPDLELIPED